MFYIFKKTCLTTQLKVKYSYKCGETSVPFIELVFTIIALIIEKKQDNTDV